MQKRLDPLRFWMTLAGAAWLLLAAYIGLTWYLVSQYQPKVILDRDGPEAVQNLGGTFAGGLYAALAPVWQYNGLIVPALVVLAAGLSVLVWSRVRRSRSVAA
jgi:hypothetical protein